MSDAPRLHPAQRWIERLTHPILLVGALLLWSTMGRSPDAVLVALVVA